MRIETNLFKIIFDFLITNIYVISAVTKTTGTCAKTTIFSVLIETNLRELCSPVLFLAYVELNLICFSAMKYLHDSVPRGKVKIQYCNSQLKVTLIHLMNFVVL